MALFKPPIAHPSLRRCSFSLMSHAMRSSNMLQSSMCQSRALLRYLLLILCHNNPRTMMLNVPPHMLMLIMRQLCPKLLPPGLVSSSLTHFQHRPRMLSKGTVLAAWRHSSCNPSTMMLPHHMPTLHLT